MLLLAAGCLAQAGSSKKKAVVRLPAVGEALCNVMQDGSLEALGIPFAAPPVGQNRFRPPQPPLYSGAHIDATAYGPACVQDNSTSDIGDVSEDCLTLNIWAPASQGGSLLPVLFWIHGGGFIEGSGKLYNGSNLAKLGIVVVTINYRLGALGWLTSEEIARENPDAPGNGAVHGLLDQVTALRWVRQNIAAFGGDKSQITMAGESAGSLSTCVHLHLPVSKGLFRRAIMESGSCVAASPWGSWNATSKQELSMDFIRSLNATDLASLRQVTVSAIIGSKYLTSVASPSVDGWYMQRNPAELPLATKGMEIVVGANTMDTLWAPPWISRLPGGTDNVPKTSQALKSLMIGYFGTKIFDTYSAPTLNASNEDVAKEFYGLSADVCNECPKHLSAQKLLAADDTVYMYEFGFSTAPIKGLACHGCEIADVFNLPDPLDISGGTSQLVASYEAHLGDTMSKYWASFVKGGQPVGSIAWPKYIGNVSTGQSLKIGTDSEGKPRITIARGLDARKCQFFAAFVKESDDHMQKFNNFCFAPVPLLSARVSSFEGDEGDAQTAFVV